VSAITWSRQARDDLDEIWLYVALDSMDAADRLIDRLTDAVRPLQSFPTMGMARPEFAQDVRAVVSGNYVIFYRMTPRGVRIDRVMDGRRDITAEDF
jgi:toxin ParE1/3/4